MKKYLIILLILISLSLSVYSQVVVKDNVYFLQEELLKNPNLVSLGNPDFQLNSDYYSQVIKDVSRMALDTKNPELQRRAVLALDQMSNSTNPNIRRLIGQLYNETRLELRQFGGTASFIEKQRRLSIGYEAKNQLWFAKAKTLGEAGKESKQVKALVNAGNYARKAEIATQNAGLTEPVVKSAKDQVLILKQFYPRRGIIHYVRNRAIDTKIGVQYNYTIAKNWFSNKYTSLNQAWADFRVFSKNFAQTAGRVKSSTVGFAKSNIPAVGNSINSMWNSSRQYLPAFGTFPAAFGVGQGAKGIAVQAAKYGGAAEVGHLVFYNLVKSTLWRSAATRALLYPPDVLIGAVSYNPASKKYSLIYDIELNRELNINRWQYIENEAFNFDNWTNSGILNSILNGWAFISETTSFDLADYGGRIINWYKEVPNLSDQELIWDCRLMIYKVKEGSTGPFKERDYSFEPVSFELNSCKSGENSSEVDLQSVLNNQVGEFEAVMFVRFDPRFILFSSDILKNTYQKEVKVGFGIFGDNMVTRTFNVSNMVWEHGLDEYAKVGVLPSFEELGGEAPPEIAELWNDTVKSYDGSKADLMAIVGMPSVPHYFDIGKGNAIVDFRESISNVFVFDPNQKLKRNPLPDEVFDGFQKIVVRNTDEDSGISLNNIEPSAIPAVLYINDISPGHYTMISHVEGEELKFNFTVEEKNYLPVSGVQ